MAFSRSEHVMSVIEQLVKTIWNRVIPNSVNTGKPFLRMTYEEAMTKVFSTADSIDKVRQR
jgi:aspartyl-tRNA synthetase